MSILDEQALDVLLGRGAPSAFFTNYDEARSFVKNSINNNSRFTPDERIRLLQLEEEANEYVFTIGWLGTYCRRKDVKGPGDVDLTKQPTSGGGASKCLLNYYLYLQNQFPLVTDDQRFLNIYDAAAEGVRAVNTSVTKPRDLFKWNRNTSLIAGAFALLFVLSRR